MKLSNAEKKTYGIDCEKTEEVVTAEAMQSRFKARVAEYQQNKNISKLELARICGLNDMTIARVIKDDKCNITLETAYKISINTGIPL